MPPTKTSELSLIRQEAEEKAFPLIPRIKILKITTETTFAQADSLLSRIGEYRKYFTGRFKKILDPLNEARTGILDLRREVVTPLEEAEDQLREGMRQYRLEEQRKIQDAERLRLAEENRLRREAEDKERKEQAAKTEQMRKRLATQREALETKADEVAAAPVAAPVQVANSGQRIIRRVQVTDLKKLLHGVISGGVPEDVIMVVSQRLDAYRRQNENLVATWPGVELFDDISIVRR